MRTDQGCFQACPSSRWRKVATVLMPVSPALALVPAMRHLKCSSPPSTAWAGITVVTCWHWWTPPTTSFGRCRIALFASIGKPWPLGYAGVYSSFLRHADIATDKYQLKTVDILLELGRRRMVGGQEDMIVDVALGII